MARLWEVDHPGYGAEEREAYECESFAELREWVDGAPAESNHIYRWDWRNSEGDDYDELFTVWALLPRLGVCISWTCPISREQEPEVRAWLRSPRVLGSLRELWAPLLDEANDA